MLFPETLVPLPEPVVRCEVEFRDVMGAVEVCGRPAVKRVTWACTAAEHIGSVPDCGTHPPVDSCCATCFKLFGTDVPVVLYDVSDLPNS